ncbi:MAG TPA: M1 family metallopeptidase [Longimicrobiales bacterium]
MSRSTLGLCAALALCGAGCSSNPPIQQSAPATVSPVAVERAVRRDIPITNMIRKAFAAGTRDSTGRPGRNYWQTSVDYSIDARLDAPSSVVSGRETIVLHNNSDVAMQNIMFRLDQNIFTGNVPRNTGVPEITDGMKVTRLAINGASVDISTPAARGQGFCPVQPGQTPATTVACGWNSTLARIALAQPIAARGTANIEVEWNFRVPLVERGRGLRMGRMADSVYQVAQWYPRVAVYDDYKGWENDPYLGNAEFYNNFGHFDVRYDVPGGWLVGSTGVLQNAEQVLTPDARARLARATQSDSLTHVVTAADRAAGNSTVKGDRLIWHFVADSVADVAWATSKAYVLSATRATIPGKGAIPIHLFYVPAQEQQYVAAAGRARHALEFYSRLWMPYAFPQLTLSYGVELGMEYPMFIMSGTGAADHEAGHEWWPMMVGVNETWWGFMDEGFNQYMNILSRNDAALCSQGKPAPCYTPAQGLDGQGQSYGRISGAEQEPPLIWDENYAGPMYSFAAYGKAPLMLSMLGGVVGDSAVWHAMSDYANAWRFKHPTPWDYAFFMNNALKQDLGWFWYYWLFTTEGVDGSIQNVATDGTRTNVVVRQDGQMPSPVVLKVQFAPGGPAITPMANSTMADSVTAIVRYPVDVWFNGSRTFNAALDFGGRGIEKITLDPFGRFPDRDPSDNVWPRSAAPAR